MAKPGGTGPVGPFPSWVADTDEARDEYDRMRRRLLWTFPSGLYVIGSRAGERRNAMTANWVTQVSFDPKLVGVGVEKEALTHELITEGRVFSVCVVDREDRAIVRKFTKPVDVGLDGRTLNGFAFVEAASGAPILAQSASYVDCSLWQSVDCGGHTFFIGEVLEARFLKDEETPVLRMEDTRMSYGG
jgi:flavin reductase (DIM6/NTAB) family NADH-FMN oxidoreductase RutF